MTIGTNDLVWKFGTLTSIDDGSTSSIINAAYSAAADISAWANSDDVPHARFILKAQWGTVTSISNRMIPIYARPINIDGTNDPVGPSTSRSFVRIGFFIVYAAAINTDYYFESSLCDLPLLKTGQEIEFYIENLSGQTISAGWTLKIMPLALGPHA